MSSWLVRRKEVPDATGTLYCFPHAGGSPGEYARWADDLPGVQVSVIQLPGKGSRFAETPFTRLPELVDALVEEIPFTGPFAFFGHSLGGLVAFETARALRDRGRQQPDHLLVSAIPAPPVPHVGAPVHALPDAEFTEQIENRWGPLPAAAHASPALLELVLRGMRADIEMFETYSYQDGPPLDRPITAFVGDQEHDRLSIDGWRAHTSKTLVRYVLPGGHFYFRTDRTPLLAHLADAMGAVRPRPTALCQVGEPR